MLDALVLLALRLLAALPLPVSQALGWCVGSLAALVPNRERANAEVNVALCFPDMPAEERRRFVRRALIENARTLGKCQIAVYIREFLLPDLTFFL